MSVDRDYRIAPDISSNEMKQFAIIARKLLVLVASMLRRHSRRPGTMNRDERPREQGVYPCASGTLLQRHVCAAP